ncbi:MAG: ATP-binding cassette domain-containing protein, partial [Anaerolineales bacterium]|nr:ATP-binding cassette domain-containing protein [Anaerolineales bacterium]
LFVFYLGWVTELPSFAGLMMAVMQQVNVSKDRLTELLQGESPLPGKVRQEVVITSSPQLLKEIKIEGLTYHYPDTDRGIENINLNLPRGSLTVITGRIGSGKTTLLRALLGLLPLEAGSIQWNGQRVEDPAKFFIPPQAAYTPQVPRLFSETLQDNILMGLPFNERIESAIYTSVLEPDLVQMEQGLDTMVGPRGVRLSGGQLQRVAIARMLMRDAELLVMDDVSSALDVETEKLFWERMNSRPSTLLVVSHRPAVLARADHILIMKEGQIDSEGRLNDLLERSDEMRELWRMEKVQ